MPRLVHLSLGLTLIANPAWSDSNLPATSSDPSYTAPATCTYPPQTLHTACGLALSLEKTNNPRAKQAGQACLGDLNTALAHEEQLNKQHKRWANMRGEARSQYFEEVLQPTSDARSQAVADYQVCQRSTMADLRPDDYPRSELLLHGRVTNVELDVGEWTVAGALQKFNDSLNPVAEPLQKLSSFLDAMAPHYDMTSRNDEGLRVIRDILIDTGMGHLVGNAPRALRAMTAKSDEAIDAARKAITSRRANAINSKQAGGFGQAESPLTGNATNNVFAPDHPLYVPPTLEIPPHIQNRTLHLQEQSHSCVQACARMVRETIHGDVLTEDWIRMASGANYTPGGGTRPGSIRGLLQQVGVPTKAWTQSSSIETLANGVNGGYPAIVNYGSRHAVVVDAVINHGGERFIVMRNPANPAVAPANVQLLQQNLGLQNVTVLREADFMPSFNAGQNVMLFTDPRL